MATSLKQPSEPPFGSPSWFVSTAEAARARPAMHIVDLTPNLAKFMLDVNNDNRGIRNSKVAQFAADMAAGRWAFNGESIIVSDDGHLNDGQHRCLAVIESNSTIKTAIVFGVPRETRLTVDQGSVKTAGDHLGMQGVANATSIAAIARLVLAFEKGEGRNLTARNRVTSAEIRARAATDPLLAEAATFGATNAHYSKRFAAGSVIGAAFYILTKVHHDDARTFLERVCRGDGLKMRDPAHTLREKLTAEGKTSQDRKITYILKAWNFHRRGMKVALSSLNKDLPFPALI